MFALFSLLLSGCAPMADRRPTQELMLWSAPVGPDEQAFVRLCRRFEREHPGVVVHNEGGLKAEKLIRAIVAGAPPDLAYLYNIPALGPLAANASVLPIDTYFDHSGLHESDFLPGAIAQGRYRGHLYAMPTCRDSRALYWNRTRFREAGLNPDRPPQTLEEMLAMAARLTRRKPDGTLAGLGLALPKEDPALLFALFGGGIWDDQTGRVTANRRENVEALTWLVALTDGQGGYKAASAFSAGLGSDTSGQNPLATGKVAMSIQGEWEAQHLEQYAPATDFALGELPHPQARPDLRNVAWMDGDFMAIPVGSRHPALAWEFMRWLQLPPQQAEYARAQSNLPTILSLRDSPSLTTGSRSKRALGYVLQHIASDARNARFLPTLPVTQLYINSLHNAFDRALYHEQTPQQALNDVQSRIATEMRRYP